MRNRSNYLVKSRELVFIALTSIVMIKNNVTFDKGFWKSFGWFLVIALLICCLPWLLAKHSWLDFSTTGQIGDTIGGIMGPFVAIAAAGLTFIAFWVQYKANIQQRHDIAIERFESNLFEMIHIQQEIINGLKIETVGTHENRTISMGRDVFQCLYEILHVRMDLEIVNSPQTLKRLLGMSDEAKKKMESVNELCSLDHYYRHLYRIFKYIDDSDSNLISEEKKYEYAAIIRATLSPYELVMLYYNGFSHPKFKELIEQYAVLNNIRCDLLASSADKKLVNEKYKDDYSPSRDENRDMSREYKKGAFVFSGI